MKKFLSILWVAVCCMTLATPAQAQLKWGVKGGVNMSKIDWNGWLEGNKDNRAGFFIGPMAEFTIPVIGLGIDGAVMYSQRDKDDFKQQGMEIPVNLKYTLGLGSMFGIYVAAGPDFFFNFKDMDLQGFEAKKKQVGLNIGAGVKLVHHLQGGVNYQIPLGDSFTKKDVHGETNSKTKTWQISLAYMF